MARVPTYDSFQVGAEVLPQPRMQSPAALDTAGQQARQIGAALGNTGNELAKMALDMQLQINQVRIDEALEAVGMTKYAKKAPHMLSGGQKQRVAIAGVLAMKPDVIILDESTAMLDPSGRREVMNTVHRLNREEGISVVIITHYMSEAATADYMIVMDDGRIAMNGTPREVFTKVDKVRALGLDVPPMTDLAHSLRADGVDVRADVLTVDEMVEEVCRLSSNI